MEAEENLKGQHYHSQEGNKMLLNERKERETDMEGSGEGESFRDTKKAPRN